MERILASPLFRNSKRYPKLLKHIVERTLEGRADLLKERALGAEVLGRDPEYDTNVDPSVRITAGEIRKRLAQYYQEPGRENEARIELPPGSYVPEFRLVSHPAAAEVTPSVRRLSRFRSARGWYIVVGAAAFLVIVLGWRAVVRPESALEAFWRPLLDTGNPVFVCVGQRTTLSFSPRSNGSEPNLHDLYRLASQNVLLADATTLARISGLLQAKGKQHRIRGVMNATLSDLRAGPVVLVGAFNNEWTLRLGSDLRFRYRLDGTVGRIVDSRASSRKEWSVDFGQPNGNVAEDYALISRFHDATTERVVVAAGGLATYGTVAAGEILTQPEFLDKAAPDLPDGWKSKNLQIVIATKVIDGISGPPRVVAAHAW